MPTVHLPLSGPRVAVATTLVCCLALAWTHAAVAVVCASLGKDPAVAAWPSTVAALLGAGFATAAALGSRSRGPVAALARRLPLYDERPGPLVSGVYVVMALVAVVQVARLATWITDPQTDWFLTTRNPFWADHECLPAYLHGVELALRGEPNIYAPHHYPALDPTAQPQTGMSGMTVEDPFQYLPQFLLLPAIGVAVTDAYPAVRAVWFAIQMTLLLGVTTATASWVGGRTGRLALVMVPLVVSAFPVLHALQYGQFHLFAVLGAVAAMMLFDRERHAAGGALMAVAILSKIFPGILLVPLVAARRWSALAWTAAFAAVLTVGALGVFGVEPFVAFVTDHVPRLGSGAAFAFGDAWPELRELVIADNQGVFGLVAKLEWLGVAGMGGSTASALNRVYAVGLVSIALALGSGLARAPREQRVMAWISLVGLGSLVSTGAFGDYVPLTAVWLATWFAPRLREGRVAAWLVPTWLVQYTLLGTTPIGEWFDPAVMIPISAIAVVSLMGLFGAGLVAPVAAQVREIRRRWTNLGAWSVMNT